MGRHTTSTSPMRSKAVLGALPIAASVVTLSAGSFAGTALASDSQDQGHHESHGTSQQSGDQTGALGQKSTSSAPASQSAPSTGISLIDLGDHEDKGHEKGHKGHDKGHGGHGKDSTKADSSEDSKGKDSKKGHGDHGKAHGDHGKKHGDHGKGHGGQSVDDHANNAADAVSGNAGTVKQQAEQKASHGKSGSVQKATQNGTLGQSSTASAPASQFAPSTGVSLVSFGGDQKVDNHANNSAKATSGNTGDTEQQLSQTGAQGKGGKHGKSAQAGSQNAGLSQDSSASAPASQFAPSTAISVLSFGGDQKVDNHANNSAKATSGNSGSIGQQLKQD